MRNPYFDIAWAKIEGACAILGGWFGYLVGGVDSMMIALLIFMALDYCTGIIGAILDKKLSSAVGFRGIAKKVLILVMVAIANIVDVHVVGSGSALRGAVISFYLANEALSCTENAVHIGLPVPDKLRDVLAQLHDREKKDSEE